MNGFYFNNTINLESGSNIIACFFINCSERAAYLDNSQASLIFNFCSFIHCTYLQEEKLKGGAIYANCSFFSIFKTRFINCGCSNEGITFYTDSNNVVIKMNSLIKNIYSYDSHYFFDSKGKVNCEIINTSHFDFHFDACFRLNDNSKARFIHFDNISARTLFRRPQTIKYFNVVNSVFQHLIYQTRIIMENGYFNNVNVVKNFSYYEVDGPTSFYNCIIIDSDLKLNEEQLNIQSTYSEGSSFKCLDAIQLLFNTCKKYHNKGRIILIINLFTLIII